MSRRKVREFAFFFLYQLEMRKDDISFQKNLFVEEFTMTETDRQYFDVLCDGVCSCKEELDKIYEPFLKGWKVSRLPKVDVVLLRIAVFEISKLEDIPKSVSINEAVVLAKKYSTEDSKSYINGILGKIPEGQKI